jgi:actin-like ATPase involved in cell morphogenesis
MTYYLGIDIGTTYTAAAVWRDGRNEIASLGNRAPTIPSVVLLRDDEAVLTGEAAVRRAATEPGRVAREFKRRVGDPTPIIVGGTPYSADALVAKLLRWVVGQVTEVEGGPPAGIAVSHPANWGNYKLDLLRQAISLADLDDVATVSEPEAAAIHYASQARVEPGSTIAVYDLGGGTFDAAVLRKTAEGWTILGTPEGIERLGGVDFDQAVFHHVAQALGGALDALDPDDPTAQAAVARLRQDCVEAKEALSSDSDVSIPVLLPNLQTEVRLTRGEYESMVRPALSDTITAMNRALRSAKVTADEVTAVLLVGGSSRTPLVAELVSSALGRPVAVDAHPKYGVAMGAALTAATRAEAVAGAGEAAAATGLAAAASGPAPATTEPPPTASDPAPATTGPGAAESGPALTPTGPSTAASGAAAHGGAGTGPATGAGAGAVAGAGAGAGAGLAAGRADRRDDDPLSPTVATPAAPRTRVSEPVAERGTGRDTRSITVPYGEPARSDRPAGTSASRRSAVPSPPPDRTRPAAATGGRDRVGPRDGTGSRGGGPGGGRRDRSGSRKPLQVAVGAIVALALLGAGAVVLLTGGDDDPGADPAAAGDTGTGTGDDTGGDDGGTPPPTTATTPVDTTPPRPDTFVEISDVELDGGQYRVNYEVTGYDPQVDGGPESLHIHFFLDTTEPQDAGNGPNAGDWDLTDESQSFLTKYTPATRGEATQMCSAVATVDHRLHLPDVLTGNCVPLPG